MKAAVDSSVLVAALAKPEAMHAECRALLDRAKAKSRLSVWPHALLETFCNLTGGRLSVRTSPANANRLITESLLPHLELAEMGKDDLLSALQSAESAGARGGAIYDWMHLCAARKAEAQIFYTLDVADFRALNRAGDPEIRLPQD